MLAKLKSILLHILGPRKPIEMLIKESEQGLVIRRFRCINGGKQ